MTLYDTRNPSRRGTLIEWIRPRHDDAFAVVKFPGSLTPERIPEHRVKLVGKLLTAKQQAALDARGWTIAKLQEVADGNGFSLQEAAEALCGALRVDAYYNEIDPYAAEWLRNLISAGLIPPGEVDTRSIKDVQPSDVEGFTQCHFFAGIGGWSYALRLAGWPDDAPVWTGSCPCQPFSAAGKRKGAADERHLWPEFLRLIAECRPAIMFGEQVASKDGRQWLAGVRADLEELGYGVGAADLCCPSTGEEGEGWFVHLGGVVERERITLGAPHIRQRLFWGARLLAEPDCERQPREYALLRSSEWRWKQTALLETSGCGETSQLDIAPSERNRSAADAGSDCQSAGEGRECCAGGSSALGELVNADSARRNARSAERQERGETRLAMPATGGEVCELGDASGSGLAGRQSERRNDGSQRTALERASGWSDFAIIPCTDGKSRRTQSSLQPLAHGIPRGMGSGRPRLERMAIRAARANRVGRLKAYGNAIVPQLAAEFVRAFMESCE